MNETVRDMTYSRIALGSLCLVIVIGFAYTIANQPPSPFISHVSVSVNTAPVVTYYGDGIVDIHGVKVNCNQVTGRIPEQCIDIQKVDWNP